MSEPLPRLLDALRASRRDGVAFPDAWPVAVCEALTGVVPRYELAQWHAALNGTRDAWQAAYEGWAQKRPERALTLVADNSDREPLREAA